jgi:hypothetical protein
MCVHWLLAAYFSVLNLDFDSTLCRVCSNMKGRDSVLKSEPVSNERLDVD